MKNRMLNLVKRAGPWFMLFSWFFAVGVQAASFDCGKARTNVEKMICTDPKLSKMDDELAELYKKMLAKSSVPDDFKPEQNWWLKERNRCADVDCIESQYIRRITSFSIRLKFQDGPNYPAGYIMTQGKGYTICEAYKKQLDKLGKIFEQDIDVLHQLLWEIPGIEEAAWQDLDVETHLDLFEMLIRYDMLPRSLQGELESYAADKTQGRLLTEAEEAENREKSKARIAEWRQKAKEGNAKLQILHADLFDNDGKSETIARVRVKRGPWKYEYGNVMYPVTEDLKELELAKVRWSHWGAHNELVLYKGGYYLVNWGGIQISRDFGTGVFPFCTIEFDITTNKHSKIGEKR